MKANLTEKFIKSLVPNEKVYEVVDTSLPCFVLRVEKSGHMSFFVVYRNKQGSRNRVKLGTYGQITLTQAREMAKQQLGAIAGGVDPQLEKKKEAEAILKEKARLITFGDFIATNYKPWVMANRKSAEHTLMLLNAYFGAWMDKPMANFTRQEVENWQIKQKTRGLKPSAINRPLNAVRAVFTRATELKIISVNPLQGLKKLPECKEIRVSFLSTDALAVLVTSLNRRNKELIGHRKSGNVWRAARGHELMPDINDHQYADYLMPMILLVINTGLRRGEVFQMQWRDINFEQRFLTVRAETAKSSKTRRIPLNVEAFRVLTTWKQTNYAENGLVFPSKNGKMLGSIKTAWGNLMRETGIDDFRFHDLRHHFASQLAMKGADLNVVRELLGHADFATTLRYAHLADSHKANAVALLV